MRDRLHSANKLALAFALSGHLKWACMLPTPFSHSHFTRGIPSASASGGRKTRARSCDRECGMKRKDLLLLLLLTFGALLVHGYHPAAEDAEIYLPGVLKILHPSDYPFGQEFFEAHARMTLFPNLIAWSVRLSHLPLAWVLFLWHLASIFVFLLACWKLGGKCFPTASGRWGGVTMMAALLTLPVAGTALYLMDQFLNPRSFSAFAVLFAIDGALEKKFVRTATWLAFAAVIHPLMTVLGISYVLLLLMMQARPGYSVLSTCLLPIGLSLRRPSAAYLRALWDLRYCFLTRWQWYEWLGAIAPLALLWWFNHIVRGKQRPILALMSLTTVVFGLCYLFLGLAVSIPSRLMVFVPYQPMRSLFLVYVFFFLFLGGFLGEWLLKNRPLRWLLLFVPLCVGMSYAQLQLFPATRRIEWPGIAQKNSWLQAFLWIHKNTPTNAIFALDPNYMALVGEDHQGFRAVAERSRLSDAYTDWSAAVMFPGLPLADDCLAQVNAAKGWKHFGPTDFERLKRAYGVTWVVLEQPGVAGLTCPYQSRAVLVCRAG